MFLFTYFSNSVLDDLAVSIDWRATSSSPPILFIEAPSLLHEISQCTLEIKKSAKKMLETVYFFQRLLKFWYCLSIVVRYKYNSQNHQNWKNNLLSSCKINLSKFLTLFYFKISNTTVWIVYYIIYLVFSNWPRIRQWGIQDVTCKSL